MNLSAYKTFVFDCDGVILDSNAIKTSSFYRATLSYGEEAAQAMVQYHVARGGISRFAKFEWFLRDFVGAYSSREHDALLERYAAEVKSGLMTCPVAEGIRSARENTPDAGWMVVSGGDQNELRGIFLERGLTELFDRGIFGSPDSKDDILAREAARGKLELPALFLGDSAYDAFAAKRAGIEFIFLHGWTEMERWEQFCTEGNYPTAPSISTVFSDVLPGYGR